MQTSKEEIQEIINEEIKEAEKKFGKQFKMTLLKILSLEKMITPTTTQEKRSRLIPLSQWNEHHEYPTVGALRQYKHHNVDNFCDVLESGGINGCRILINEDKFFEWHKRRTATT